MSKDSSTIIHIFLMSPFWNNLKRERLDKLRVLLREELVMSIQGEARDLWGLVA